MDDNYIITGMSSIINHDNVKTGIDLKDIEKKIMKGTTIKNSYDPQEKLAQELKNTAKSLGLTFGDTKFDINDNITEDTPPPPSNSIDDVNMFARKSPSPVIENRSWTSRMSQDKKDDSLDARTHEQKRRDHIDNIMGDAMGFSFEKEKKEDIKMVMLSEIDSLISTLSEEDADLSRIPQVTRMNSFDEVESVLKNLRHKNDHLRYCTFAEEFLLFGAHALEDLFDGNKTWFGRYKPDLTGWHNHVNIKLRRMRHDTGQLVNGVMSELNISPAARILFELVPSMVLYSRTRKQQYSKPNISVSDSEMDAARERIRSMN